MSAPNIANRDIRLDVAATLYRLGEAMITAVDAFNAATAPDVGGDTYAALRDAHSAAEAALRQCLLNLGYRSDGHLPPIRGTEGRRLFIRYWEIAEPLGWPDAQWIADQDIDLQAAVQAQNAADQREHGSLTTALYRAEQERTA